MCVRACVCVCVCFAYFPDGISKTWIPPTALTHVERQSFRRSRIDVVYLRVFSLSPVQIFAPGRVCVCACARAQPAGSAADRGQLIAPTRGAR